MKQKSERTQRRKRQIYYHSCLFNTPLAVKDRPQRASVRIRRLSNTSNRRDPTAIHRAPLSRLKDAHSLHSHGAFTKTEDETQGKLQ